MTDDLAAEGTGFQLAETSAISHPPARLRTRGDDPYDHRVAGPRCRQIRIGSSLETCTLQECGRSGKQQHNAM